MKFFDYLDNVYRNADLDKQIAFSLAKDGYQQASHWWVLKIRSFFKVIRIISLPFEYVLVKLRVMSPGVDYNSRISEIEAMAKKRLAAAKAAEQANQPVPVNQDAATQQVSQPIQPAPVGNSNGNQTQNTPQ